MNSINYQLVIVKHSDYLPFQEIPLKIKFAIYNCFAKSAFLLTLMFCEEIYCLSLIL